MKFTDGYWLRSENVQASYASQAFTVERIPHGMRIAAPERRFCPGQMLWTSRSCTLIWCRQGTMILS